MRLSEKKNVDKTSMIVWLLNFVVHLLLQVFFAVLLLQLGHIISPWFSHNITKIVGIVVAVYLTINCIPGILLKGKKGQLVMVILSAVVAVCYWLNALAY